MNKASSVSKIQCFDSCHYKYKLTYIDKKSQIDSSSFEKGRILHYILENIKYFDIIKKFLDSDVGKMYYPIIYEGEKEKRVALKLLDGKLVCCGYDDDCIIRGVIDVVSNNNIIDYKSGRYVEYNNQSWLQLEFYALWLFLNSDYEEITVSYIYIEHSKVNSRVIKRSETNNIIKNIFSKISTIMKYESNPNEDHKISGLCEYCGARMHCKFYNVDLETVDISLDSSILLESPKNT